MLVKNAFHVGSHIQPFPRKTESQFMLRCAALVREHTRVSAGVCTRLCETPIFCSGPAVKDQDGEPALTLPEARRMINAQLGMHHCIIIN